MIRRSTRESTDRERFELLYRQHFRAVLGYGLARLGPEQAKDVTAETFLVAWRRLDDVPDDPLPWLLGVARKVISGQLRGDARRAALHERMLTERTTARRPVPDLPPDPADVVASRDSALAALEQLSPMDREALTLLAWDGLDTRQAAEALGISLVAFAVRLHRARKRLSEAFRRADGTACDPARSAQPAQPGQPAQPKEARR
jgi:RNA polymerase sigma-70 factor (ECF subfamily)